MRYAFTFRSLFHIDLLNTDYAGYMIYLTLITLITLMPQDCRLRSCGTGRSFFCHEVSGNPDQRIGVSLRAGLVSGLFHRTIQGSLDDFYPGPWKNRSRQATSSSNIA